MSQLLADLRSWLELSDLQGAPVTLLYCCGESLARAEHLIRSAGQVVFWPLQAVQALVALMQLYGSLMLRCVPPPSSKRGSACGYPAAPLPSQTLLLAGGLSKLLVREDLLGMLAEALELVHFDAAFASGSRRLTAVLGAAIPLWGFLGYLVRFAAIHKPDGAGATTTREYLVMQLHPSRPVQGERRRER